MGYCEYLVQSTHVMTSKLLQNYVNMLRGSSCDISLDAFYIDPFR